MNIKRAIYRKLSIALPLFIVIAQLLMPLATAEKVKADNLYSNANTPAIEENSPTIEEIDAKFVQLLQNYANAPAAEEELAFNRGFSFAMSITANRAAREDALTLATANGTAYKETTPNSSSKLLETAFIKLLEAYANIPADAEPELRMQAEYAFSMAGNALAMEEERLVAAEMANLPATATAPVGTDAPFTEEQLLHDLESYMNDPDGVSLDNIFAATDASQPPTVAYGPQEDGWGLEAQNEATGQEVSWAIDADPESLANFNELFGETMATAPATAETAAMYGPPALPTQEIAPTTGSTTTSLAGLPVENSNNAMMPEVAPAMAPAQGSSFVSLGPITFITHTIPNAYTFNPIDIDGDGDVDLFGMFSPSVFDDWIVWYENTSGDGMNWITHTIAMAGSNNINYYGLEAADVDNDGDADVITVRRVELPLPSTYYLAWYENTAGDGTAWTERFGFETYELNYGITDVADMNQDGDIDVIGNGPSNGVRFHWYENINSYPYWSMHTVERDTNSRTPVDIDKDGDMDFLASFGSQMSWLENATGDGTNWDAFLISNDAGSIFKADMDGDANQDALVNATNGNGLLWYEYTSSWNQRSTIDITSDGGGSVITTDFDGDGDQDIFHYGFDPNNSIWYENLVGNGTLWATHSTAIDASYDAQVADIDGDGDLDIFANSRPSPPNWQAE